MGKKKRFDFEEKLYAVLCYEQGTKSFKCIADEICAGTSTVKNWWMIYQSQGEQGLIKEQNHKHWDKNIIL